MKKFFKLISILTLTTVISSNVSACDFQVWPAPDFQHTLDLANDYITNNNDPQISSFVVLDKNKMQIKDYAPTIITNLNELLYNHIEHSASVILTINNSEANITFQQINDIAVHLAIVNHPDLSQNCLFHATFDKFADFIKKRLKPTIDETVPLVFPKTAGDLHQDLLDAGAEFKKDQATNFTTSSAGPISNGSKFWEDYADPRKLIFSPWFYINNTLINLLSIFSITWDYDDLSPIKGSTDVIFVCGNKVFSKFDKARYDYIKIFINIKYDIDKEQTFNQDYDSITFIFKD